MIALACASAATLRDATNAFLRTRRPDATRKQAARPAVRNLNQWTGARQRYFAIGLSWAAGITGNLGTGDFRTRFWGRGSISTIPPSTPQVSGEEQGTSVAVSNEPTAEAIIVTEPDRTLVPASDLPPAADVLESLFAEEHPSAEGTIVEGTVAEDAAVAEESNLADEAPTDTPSISFLIANDLQEDAAVEHAAISQALESFAESQPSSSSPEISTDLVDPGEPSTEPREESQADLFSADNASRGDECR